MNVTMNASRKRTRRTKYVFPGEVDDSVDEDDLLVVRGLGLTDSKAQKAIDVRRWDMEKRIWKLRVPWYYNGDCECGSQVSALPNSIGQLQGLELLDLFGTNRLSRLPKEIGYLVNLQVLDLGASGIISLPSSIGQLKNLQELNLYRAKKLFALPIEIGNLTRLKKLDLSFSSIIYLPHSMGRLVNLTLLNLSDTPKLSLVPEAMYNLASLTRLYLRNSAIRALHPAIKKLQNLRVLDLAATRNLVVIPDEVGDLANLKALITRSSSIPEVPLSIINRISYSHASDLIKSRVKFFAEVHNHHDHVAVRGWGWSLVLHMAENMFSGDEFAYTWSRHDGTVREYENHKPLFPLDRKPIECKYRLPKLDAMYLFLIHGKDSFIQVLLNRPTNPVSRHRN